MMKKLKIASVEAHAAKPRYAGTKTTYLLLKQFN